MSELEPQLHELHKRTLKGINEVLERTVNSVDGLEKMVVSRAIQVLQPRLNQRIRAASEEGLRAELKYLHNLLETMLADKQEKKSTTKRTKPRRKKRKSPSQGA